MDEQRPTFVPHTPPSHHRRLDSFPTDDIDGDSVLDDNGGVGTAPSISLGAFPVFLIQESPGKPVPQFPESPESSYGFQSPPGRTAPTRGGQLLRRVESLFGAEEYLEELDWGCSGLEQQTPTRAPIRVVRTISDDQWDPPHLDSSANRKPSFAKSIGFGRSLFQDDDETLLGHYEVSDGKLGPTALRYSSSTSTSLASPLSDTFSPASTSCSISTNSSRFSPRAPPGESHNDYLESEEFPIEVGGSTSLDLEITPAYEQVVSDIPTTILELKPLPASTGMANTAPINDTTLFVTSPGNTCFTLASTHGATTHKPYDQSDVAPYLSPDSIEVEGHPRLGTVIPSRPLEKQKSYGQLGLFQHPHFPLSQLNELIAASDSNLPDGIRSVSSPSTHTPTPTSPVRVTRRRAFSGTREHPQGIFTNELCVPGRLRSSSVNSSDHHAARIRTEPSSNDLIVQAARSRANSASGTDSHAPSTCGRTLNSSKSKESIGSKFANLPEYAAFLREIVLELWIDQEGFRAIRPRFELHQYTPGQLAPARSTAVKSPPTSPVRSIIRRSVGLSPVTPPRQSRFSRSSPGLKESLSMENIFSPVGSPVRADRPPSSLGQEAIEAPVEPQFLQNWGVAEFTMKRKQSWNFHHGIVDGEPVLRRMTVNGVEDRDYLSREAALSVKSNGTYTVKGTEDRGRFEWKFEYLVEDRRGPSGAVIQGEKTLTPLSFSCAPELLIPEQGKKVTLLHVMKKSVVPRIQPKVDSHGSEPSTPGHASCGSAGRKLEALTKIVRHQSSKSSLTTPKHGSSRRSSSSQTPSCDSASATEHVHEGVDEYGRRRAGSYSSMRPDLRGILGTHLED
ncbi:hypothetical protein CTheo_3363 [Ceratobasidium theobromae]|uniref:Uncharacterized protein n=1 Tax=Ceratobasidium theobromae TaxID=1582974 RepID=A0A5N5QN54_9AGAM|nr:hypothetical protein CTheo_3363 [Ceratobasidium theobromae]